MEYKEITPMYKKIVYHSYLGVEPITGMYYGSGLLSPRSGYFRHGDLIFFQSIAILLFDQRLGSTILNPVNTKVFAIEGNTVTFKPMGLWVSRMTFNDEPYIVFIYHGHKLCIMDAWDIRYLEYDNNKGCFYSWSHKQCESTMYTFDAKAEVYIPITTQLNLSMYLVFEIYLLI